MDVYRPAAKIMRAGGLPGGRRRAHYEAAGAEGVAVEAVDGGFGLLGYRHIHEGAAQVAVAYFIAKDHHFADFSERHEEATYIRFQQVGVYVVYQ
jgi:hypothetical protein